MKRNQPPRKIKQLFGLQCGLVVFLSAITGAIFGKWAAYSAFLGGIVCILPSYLFALIAFRYRGAHAAKDIVKSFYWGEAVKIMVTVFLFTLVFSTMKVAVGFFLLAFILVQFTFWIGPLVLKF